MFEPLWNSHYVDHVQITMAEDIGIGTRAGYYDGVGAARDVIQNHLLQLLALTAMEEPVTFNADDVRVEKEKVLSAVRLPEDLSKTTATGQYSAGWQAGEFVRSFHEEDNIDPDSRTETYAAMTLFVDTRRWAGVPFYLRTGKRLGKRVTEIAIVFKRAAHIPFDNESTQELGNNALVIRVQPDEGVTIRFGSKVPGIDMRVRDVTMDFGMGTRLRKTLRKRMTLRWTLSGESLFPLSVRLSGESWIGPGTLGAVQARTRPERGAQSADDMLSAPDGTEVMIQTFENTTTSGFHLPTRDCYE